MGDIVEPETAPPKVPDAPPQRISAQLTLQPPLSRRGHGPGLILVVDLWAEIEQSDKNVDPPPLTKWAEEGFAVVQVTLPGKVEDGGEFPLEKAIDLLRTCNECDDESGFGLVSYLSRIPFYVEETACLSPHIKAIVSYRGRKFTSINSEATSVPPQLIHIPGLDVPRCESRSIVPGPSTSLPPVQGPVKTFTYVNAMKCSSWVLPASNDYHAQSAGLAHTRSLQFLKPLLGGPWFDLEAIWDEHCLYEFGERDVDRTMATMVAQPYVNHIPTMTGGIGKERLTAFYTNHFIFANPEDTALDLVSRTVGTDRVIDEFIFKLTHDRQVDWLLPGIPPTGRFLEIPFTSVVAMRGDRLCHEHIAWDQGTALKQAGLLPEWVNFPYAIGDNSAGQGKRFEVRLPVGGVETARKLVDEGSVESNQLMEVEVRKVDDV